ncbi:MAG: RNA methyltransferase [Eubacterium sp.]|nr:RNA methyltransferase [Eubacterium sp.]
MITSRDNPRIKKIKKLLKKSKYRTEEGCFVIEGFKAVEEALESDRLREVYIKHSLVRGMDTFRADPDGVRRILREKPGSRSGSDHEWSEALSFFVEIVDDRVFDELSDTVTPQGMIGIADIISYDTDTLFEKDDCRVLCLEDVRDPGNIGTMIRTAEAAGMSAVLLSDKCADVYQPKTVRSTMGSIFRVPCISCEGDFTAGLNRLKEKGFTLYAACLSGASDYLEPDYEGRTGILIGNEANGLSDEAIRISQVHVKIPMAGKVESLNAAVSAALVMYAAVQKSMDVWEN